MPRDLDTVGKMKGLDDRAARRVLTLNDPDDRTSRVRRNAVILSHCTSFRRRIMPPLLTVDRDMSRYRCAMHAQRLLLGIMVNQKELMLRVCSAYGMTVFFLFSNEYTGEKLLLG